jgi:hypothetical protein
LSYEDMARSHVKELLRTAFRWEQVVVDEDGDVLDRGEVEEPIDPIAYERGLSAGRYP